MKITLVKTPTHTTPEIIIACEKLSEFNPIFIDISTVSWANINKCALNVKRFTEEFGGTIVYGWDVAMWGNVLLDCVGHAIIIKDNKFIDITPSKYGNSNRLFVQDNNLSFDYTSNMSRMPSKMIAISRAKEVRQLINLEEKIYEIKIKYPVTSELISLDQDDATIITKLENQKQKLVPKIILTHTHHGDPCICGSNKKFRKCCQNKFK